MVNLQFDGESFQFERVIADVKSKHKKSIIVFIGGIHGNEPTGAIALKKVFSELSTLDLHWQGDVYAFTGNLKALAAQKRFIHRDLNRVWTPNQVLKLQKQNLEKTIAETEEQYALYDLIWPLLDEKVPIYFIDLHTTSSASPPFITINDILVNRDFSLKFPLPVVMGIEEYISGPLLSYMNNLETVSLAFEGGQHEDKEAVKNHISFINMAMVMAGVIDENELPNYSSHRKRLIDQGLNTKGIYEIRYKKHIEPGDGFEMSPGYANFDKIKANDLIATDNTGELRAFEKGRIFMPLYQILGNDGYFIIRAVPKWAMVVSRVLRRLKIDNLLTAFPGVYRDSEDKNSIVVNKNIALFRALDLFHLLGYRRKKTVNNKMYFSKREVD